MKKGISILAAGFMFVSGYASAAIEDARVVHRALRENPQVLFPPLSIRAGSPNDAGLSLNGLTLRNPYSGLYSADLPFLQNIFSAPTVKTGLENTGGHSVATAAFEVKPIDPLIQATIEGGFPGLYGGQLSGRTQLTDSLGFGGFFDNQHVDEVDFEDNDLDRLTVGAHAHYLTDGSQLDLLVGHEQKKFGARGYYGAPASVFAEERTEDSLALLSFTRGDLSGAYFRATANYRQFDDEYSIPSTGFMNEIDTRQTAFILEGKTIEIQHIALKMHGDIQNEAISSTLAEDDRTYGSIRVLPQITIDSFRLTAGLNSTFYTDHPPDYLPQAGIDYFLSDNSTLYASYVENTRLPFYRDLYYVDPYHIGNSTLNRQKTRSSEIGFRQFLSATVDWHTAAFYRQIDCASDWVKDNAADVQWRVADLGTMDVAGVEAAIHYAPSDALNLRVFYQWATKDSYDFYAGLYELDYPEHLLNVEGSWKITPEIQLIGAQTLRYQAGNNARNSSDSGADASIGLQYFPRFAPNVRLSVSVDNLWGSTFEPIPGQKAPKRTFSSGITIGW